MPETGFLMRFEGGPLSGETALTTTMAWPLPERVEAVPSGEFSSVEDFALVRATETLPAYVKVGESQLAEDVPGVVRGAQYEWHDA